MSIPLRQKLAVGAYIASKRLQGVDKYPLVLQLEPLYLCNLACAGCGKIQHSDDILARRLSVEQCVVAVEECGAPIVSIAGGEPLIHREIHEIARELVERKKFVYLCTNAIMMERKLDLFEPSPYFAWSVHIDGLRERHDESVCRSGIFDKAVAAVREAQRRGFRVTTNSTFFGQDDAVSIRAVLDYLNDELEVDTMQIAPGFAYEKAPDQEHFLGVQRTREIFREAFKGGRRSKWRLNHSPLYLDFLEGKADFMCTAWAYRHTRCWAGSDHAISCRTSPMPAVTRSSSSRRIGANTDEAVTPSARTAWRTAVMSRARCKRRLIR